MHSTVCSTLTVCTGTVHMGIMLWEIRKEWGTCKRERAQVVYHGLSEPLFLTFCRAFDGVSERKFW